jgi:cytochrome c oxidase assembly protein subunit 15
VGLHFVISTGLIALASLLVWRALPKPVNSVARWNANLAWPTVVVGFIAICMGVIVTGAGPHAGDALTPRNGFDLEIWQHYHSYPGYTLLALITLQLVAQVVKSRSLLKQLESRILLLLFVATVFQAVVGVIQARMGVPALLVGIHMLGSGVLTALITFQVLSARKINR